MGLSGPRICDNSGARLFVLDPFFELLSVCYGWRIVLCMSAVAADLSSVSTGGLVDAVEAVVLELAGRGVPESGLVCMEVAERLGRVLDVGESALVGLLGGCVLRGCIRRGRFFDVCVVGECSGYGAGAC